MVTRIGALFHYRELLRSLTSRDIILRYKGSVFGFLWALMNPLFTILIFTFVFSGILRMGIPNYPLFLFSAIIPWNFFQQALVAATPSIQSYGSIITKVYFPREIVPLSLVFSNFVHTFLIGFVVNVILILLFHAPINLSLLWIFPLCAAQVAFTAGLALILSCLQVYYRDVAVLLNQVLMLLFYATPIIYPLEYVPEPWHTYIMYNPLTGMIDSYRAILLYGRMPDPGGFWYAFSISFVTLLAGYLLFNRYQDYFAEEI